ncbi:MAG: MarR family transcriptional regulator [Erysipelotrichaceae bacterium]|nr:MarR family transcriptional regulator [Erysipelotrichaceae bacterium]
MERSIIKEIRHMEMAVRKNLSQGKNPMKIYSYTQIEVLRYLFSHPDENVCQKDLEIVTGLKKASMTGCLNVLEEKGLIVRETAEDDKRRNYIRLTDMIKEEGAEIEARGKKLDELITMNICNEDLDAFFRVAEKIVENVDKVEKENISEI